MFTVQKLQNWNQKWIIQKIFCFSWKIYSTALTRYCYRANDILFLPHKVYTREMFVIEMTTHRAFSWCIAKSILKLKGQLQRSWFSKILIAIVARKWMEKAASNFHKWLPRYGILKFVCYLINYNEFSCDITDEHWEFCIFTKRTHKNKWKQCLYNCIMFYLCFDTQLKQLEEGTL